MAFQELYIIILHVINYVVHPLLVMCRFWQYLLISCSCLILASMFPQQAIQQIQRHLLIVNKQMNTMIKR